MRTTDVPSHAPLLDATLNLSRFHRDHEQLYASTPRERAVHLQRHARTLHAVVRSGESSGDSAGSPT